MSQLVITFFNTADKSTERVDNIPALHHLVKEKQGFYWLDLNDPDPTHFTQILKALNIPCEWPNHFRRPEILPHMYDSPRLLSFYLYDIVDSETLLDSGKAISSIEYESIFVMLGERFVITYRQRNLDLIDFVQKDCAENFKMSGKTPAFVLFLIMQHCMYYIARLNLANDNFLDDIEYNVLTSKGSAYLPKISIAGLNILLLKKLNANMHIILLVMVTKTNHVIGESARVFFNNMLENTLGIRESIDSSRDLLDSIIASIQAESMRQTGEIMRVLTILSAIFMPPTLIAGIYGMNFQSIAEYGWRYGYIYSLALMAGVTALFVGAFYWFGWVGKKKDAKALLCSLPSSSDRK